MPHLAHCATRIIDASRNSMQGLSGSCNILCSDVRSVTWTETQRCDLVVTELLDASGFGERLVPILRHAKDHLLRERAAGEIIPSALRIMAALVDLRLPKLA